MLAHEKGRFVLNTTPESAGFTLIEVMIVVAIVAIVTTLGLPSYRAWIQNTQIYNAAESVQNGLQKAKSEALSRNTNVAFVLNGASPDWISSWTILDVSSGATIDSRSGSDGSKNVTAKGLAKNGTAATTITFNNLGTVGVPPNLLNSDGSAPLTQIDFDSPKLPDSRKMRVTIGINGVGSNIRMCNPNLRSDDPRKC
jgi:type IV fimbrial biogenesis protein FimT